MAADCRLQWDCRIRAAVRCRIRKVSDKVRFRSRKSAVPGVQAKIGDAPSDSGKLTKMSGRQKWSIN